MSVLMVFYTSKQIKYLEFLGIFLSNVKYTFIDCPGKNIYFIKTFLEFLSFNEILLESLY